MRNEKYILVVYSALILSPILALPLIIYGIYHQYKGCQTALAVFMALLAFLTAPVGDLYRHTIAYFMMETYTYNRFVSTIESDFIMQFLEYFMARHNIPYEYLRLVYTFIAYSIFNYIFNQLISGSDCQYRKSEYFSRYILSFMSLNFFGLVLGVRFTFAASVFTLGAYYYLCERRKIPALLFFTLSIFIHYSFLYYGLFIILFIHIRINKRIFVLFLLLGLIISELLISRFESFLLKENLQGASYLGDGKWAKGYREQQELINVLFLYVKYIVCLPIALYVLRTIRKERIHRYILALILLVAVTFSLGNVSGRVTTIFYSCIPMLVLYEERQNQKKIPRPYYKATFYAIFLMYAATFYGMKNPRHNSEYQYIAAPTPIILTNHYDRIWIYQHVNNDGSGKYRDE